MLTKVLMLADRGPHLAGHLVDVDAGRAARYVDLGLAQLPPEPETLDGVDVTAASQAAPKPRRTRSRR